MPRGTSIVEQFIDEQLNQMLESEMNAQSILNAHPNVARILAESEPIETAKIFAAMLLDKRLQANCLRLEMLIHLAIAAGKKEQVATSDRLAACFNELGDGLCGRMEDPAEDVMVSVITSSEGCYRVLEGINETGTFYLQRVINIVETWPNEEPFKAIKDAVFGLLRLSEEVCRRADLERYTVGESNPCRRIDKSYVSQELSKVIEFTEQELNELGIHRDALDHFNLPEKWWHFVETCSVSTSPLQQCVIIKTENQINLIMPTSVSTAIRGIVLGFVERQGYSKHMSNALIAEYQVLLQRTALLGDLRRAPIWIDDSSGLCTADAVIDIDIGRYVHLLFYFDPLEGIQESGVSGRVSWTSEQVEKIEGSIGKVFEELSGNSDFRGGVTFLVYCGIGRASAMPFSPPNDGLWRVESMAIADLLTISNCPNRSALGVWKVLENVSQMEGLGLEILQTHGLLNLLAYVDGNGGHLVQHSSVPEEVRQAGGIMQILPSYVLNCRQRIAKHRDVISVQTPNGEYREVRRLRDSDFSQDIGRPLYATTRSLPNDEFQIVFRTEHHDWWFSVKDDDLSPMAAENLKMLIVWVPKIASVLDKAISKTLPSSTLLCVEFSNLAEDDLGLTSVDLEAIEGAISFGGDEQSRLIKIMVGEEFEYGLQNSENISERALVRAIIRGYSKVFDLSLDKQQEKHIESLVVKNNVARQRHVFHSISCRQFLRSELPNEIVKIEEYDVARVQCGLAFRGEDREGGRRELRAKTTCTKLLNDIVSRLEVEVCDELYMYNRREFLEVVLKSYERASYEKELWTRTATANVALRDNEVAALVTVASVANDFNAVLLPLRVLQEMALCECPVDSGVVIGKLELARLMAKVNAIFHLGGWSDAIHRDAMPPRLRITPLGDVQADTTFEQSIVKPFAARAGQNIVEAAMERHDDNYRDAKVIPDAGLDAQFEAAWLSEFGFSIGDLRHFMDTIEDLAMVQKLPVMYLRRSRLIEMLSGDMDIEIARRIIEEFTLETRSGWKNVPEEFNVKDIQPWLFRRALSALRRPFLQVELSRDDPDPELVFAPGGIRESLGYTIGSYFEGQFRDWHYKSKEMRAWVGRRKNERGSQFASLVAERLTELGWQVETPEFEIKSILRTSFIDGFGDLKTYGDVDVLAWHAEQKRVLIVECKHLQFHKTPGEIAEQLSDYRGKEKRNGKPDDLMKHLRRVKLLTEKKSVMCRNLGMPADMRVEGWVVFKNPVPIIYAWEDLEDDVTFAVFDDLESRLSESGIKGDAR